jgi:hypothetical protein
MVLLRMLDARSVTASAGSAGSAGPASTPWDWIGSKAIPLHQRNFACIMRCGENTSPPTDLNQSRNGNCYCISDSQAFDGDGDE